MELQLAWRNIWRNPKRTTVILTAIVIGCWSMIAFASFGRGMITANINNTLNDMTGHLQIRHKDYWNDPVVDYLIDDPSTLYKNLDENLPKGSRYTSRLQVLGIAANARNSRGVTIFGIEPGVEETMSFYGDNYAQGEGLKKGERGGIVIGESMAETFKIRLGQKIILMSQDIHGEIASGVFRLKGVFIAEMESAEKQNVFISKEDANRLLDTGQSISNISVILPDHEMSEATTLLLKDKIKSSEVDVRDWKTILPIAESNISTIGTMIYLWALVIFTGMGIGIVNTTLMAILERTQEFGLLKALGMRPSTIVKGIILESAVLLLLGIALGNILGIATALILNKVGLDFSVFAQGAEAMNFPRYIYPEFIIQDALITNSIVCVLGLLVCLYPAIKASKITPIEAMSSSKKG